ncbi:MAG: hypothetical protein AB7P76_03805 [Candidatus Melainabacteria bacterium]
MFIAQNGIRHIAQYRPAHAQQRPENCQQRQKKGMEGIAGQHHHAHAQGAANRITQTAPLIAADEKGQRERHPDNRRHVIHVIRNGQCVTGQTIQHGRPEGSHAGTAQHANQKKQGAHPQQMLQYHHPADAMHRCGRDEEQQIQRIENLMRGFGKKRHTTG